MQQINPKEKLMTRNSQIRVRNQQTNQPVNPLRQRKHRLNQPLSQPQNNRSQVSLWTGFHFIINFTLYGVQNVYLCVVLCHDNCCELRPIALKVAFSLPVLCFSGVLCLWNVGRIQFFSCCVRLSHLIVIVVVCESAYYPFYRMKPSHQHSSLFSFFLENWKMVTFRCLCLHIRVNMLRCRPWWWFYQRGSQLPITTVQVPLKQVY